MKLLAKLTTLARALVSERKAHSDAVPSSTPGLKQPGLKQKEAQPPDTLEQVRVADLLREQLEANKEKGE